MASPDGSAPPSPPRSERDGTAEADVGNRTRLTKNGRAMPRRIQAVGDVPGYPPKDAPIPANLTCKEVCEQYPNGLYGETLDPFIHHNWASGQIYDALQQDAKIWMTQNQKDGIRCKNPANALTKRLQKRREKLAKDGTYDALMNATNIRPQGQHHGFQATGNFPVPTAAANPIKHPANPQPAGPPTIDPRLGMGYNLGPQRPVPPAIDPRLRMGYGFGPQLAAPRAIDSRLRTGYDLDPQPPASPAIDPRLGMGYDHGPRPAKPPTIDPRLLTGNDFGLRPADPSVIDPRLLMGSDIGLHPAVGMPAPQVPPADLPARFVGAEPDQYWGANRSADATRGGRHVYELPHYHEAVLLSGLGPVPDASHLPPVPNYGEEIDVALARFFDVSWNGPDNEGGNAQPPVRAFIEGFQLPGPPPNSPNQQPDNSNAWAEAAAAADARHYGLPPPARLQPAQTDDEYGFPPNYGIGQWMPGARAPVPDSNFMYDIKEEAGDFQGFGQY